VKRGKKKWELMRLKYEVVKWEEEVIILKRGENEKKKL